MSALDKRACSFFVFADNYKRHNSLYNNRVGFVQIIRQQKSNGRERKMAKKAIETAGLSEVKAEERKSWASIAFICRNGK